MILLNITRAEVKEMKQGDIYIPEPVEDIVYQEIGTKAELPAELMIRVRMVAIEKSMYYESSNIQQPKYDFELARKIENYLITGTYRIGD